METVALNPRTYSTDTFAHITLFATTTTSNQPIINAAVTTYRPPIVRVIDGWLSEGRRLAHPLSVIIEYDEDEVVVSEPHFHMHASAPTEAEAIAAFRRIFSGYLDILTSQEETLGAHLRDQLQFLRSIIRST